MAGTTLEMADRRSAAHRSNVMFAATLRADGGDVAVRVRNLSETGALIEGVALPSPATAIRLFRNNLSVGGSIVWSAGGRAGLHFDTGIDTKYWITSGLASPTPSAVQARVDTIQQAARAGILSMPAQSLPDVFRASLAAAMPARIAEELAYVRRLVESIGDDLVGDPTIVSRHPSALQRFDLAGQILGLLGTLLLADDKVAAAERIGQQELKARLLRKV